MPKSRHFGAGFDTMQQVHGASVKSNGELSVCNFAPVRFFFIFPECFIMTGSKNKLR